MTGIEQGIERRIGQLRAVVDSAGERRAHLERTSADLARARGARKAAVAALTRAERAAAAALLPRGRGWLNLLTGRYTHRRCTATETVVAARTAVEAADEVVQRLVVSAERAGAGGDAVARARAELAELEDAQRLSLMLAADDPRAERVRALDGELADLAGQAREVEEARAAARGARAAIGETLDRLASAHAWGTYDTFFGGGLISSAIKHDRIDAANASAARVRRSLERVRAELADVRADLDAGHLDLDGFTRGVDVLFDNVFTDWSVQSRIKDQQEAVERVRDRLDQVLGQLDRTARELEARRHAALGRRRSLLDDTGPSRPPFGQGGGDHRPR